MGYFDEDLGVMGEVQQELQFVWLIDGAVGHMVDDDGEVWIFFDE